MALKKDLTADEWRGVFRASPRISPVTARGA
jgi:hypothetical protein